jgi:hypothetical protein
MQEHSRRNFSAYLERRNRLWLQIKAACPVYTEAEIEARLEQLGAWVQAAGHLSDPSSRMPI